MDWHSGALVVKAHAVLAKACTTNSLTRRFAAHANTARRCSSNTQPPTVAIAHAVLARSYALKSLTRHFDARATTDMSLSSFSCNELALARAHDRLARFCTLNPQICLFAALISTTK
eukprot:gnl/TRDRNA2_/TRDRNA2_162428_c2_seq2.p2 gnl/TRDRNA2_/TRDRNA2_162428_c2~~gnl/TRDRNA2_/TRDRNA2_162428_c2_seq2.p2  ORF type:complete len:117 (-),score=6.92 gnl/TRDRNA2_/TRDRNA2_162428_c2_seq2:51-401(-)